ncbi:hypothetical protein, partial [Streptomyces triticirhizae]
MTEHRPGPRREPDREPTDAHPEREPTAREGDEPTTDAGRTDVGGTDAGRTDVGSGAFGAAERGRHEAGAPGRGAGRHEDLGDLPPERAAGDADAEVEELRRLFRETVGDLEPGPDSLDNLRVAVPLRRRRRRHLLLGTAASVALLSIGAPLMASVADSVGGQDSAMDTSNGGGPPGSWGESGGPGDTGEPHPSGGGLSDRSDGGADSDGGSPFGSGDPGEGDPTDARETLGVTSPSCLREQLGRVVTDTEPPDENGRIYGLIRMVNVSNEPCRVTGEGELAVLSDAAGSSPVRVVDRTEGDRATGLPAPDEAHDELILPPGEGFEVRFAWVPDGPTLSGCAIAANPTPGAGSSHSPQLRTDDPEGSATGGDSGGDSASGGSGDSAGGGGSGDSDGSSTTTGASGGGGAGGTGATGTAGASGSPGSSGSDGGG